MLLLNPKKFGMIIDRKKHRLFAIEDVRKIQFERLRPIEDRFEERSFSPDLTCAAITSMRFKTAMSAVTSFGAIVLILAEEVEPAKEV